MIDEGQGRQILRQAFQNAGFQIQEDFPFPIAGTVIRLDGYDPAQRVGYEYVTTSAGDRHQINERVVEELDRLNEDRLVHILMVDEQHISTSDDLAFACNAYLEELSLGG
jgi:hypothetical protein